jgi:hypothetical protein
MARDVAYRLWDRTRRPRYTLVEQGVLRTFIILATRRSMSNSYFDIFSITDLMHDIKGAEPREG